MTHKNLQQNIESLSAINIPLKHNHHQLLSNYSVYAELEGQPSDRKLILSSKLSIRNLKTIRA